MKEIFAYMVLFTKDMVGFSQTAMQRARGAYFANRHDTFWKELNFNFPEHQKILKFIKISLRNLKKCEIVSQHIFRFMKHAAKCAFCRRSVFFLADFRIRNMLSDFY